MCVAIVDSVFGVGTRPCSGGRLKGKRPFGTGLRKGMAEREEGRKGESLCGGRLKLLKLHLVPAVITSPSTSHSLKRLHYSSR